LLEDFVDKFILQFALEFVGVHQMVEFVFVVAMDCVFVLFVGFTYSRFNLRPYAMFYLLLYAEPFIVVAFMFQLFHHIVEMLVFVFYVF
jgi:hypothetical protein